MAELIFIGRSDDNSSLVFSDDDGNEHVAVIDDQLIHSVTTRATIVDLRGGALGVSPRDIQARLRRGETIANIAHEAGESPERVERYAGPVFAERHHMAVRARETYVRRPLGDTQLGTIVDEVLLRHDVDIMELEWDSYRREDSRWNITLRWPSGDGSGFAVWIFDPQGHTVLALDDQARWIFDDSATPLKESVADSRPRLVSIANNNISNNNTHNNDLSEDGFTTKHSLSDGGQANSFTFDQNNSSDDMPFDQLLDDDIDSPAWAGPGQPTIPVYLPTDAAPSSSGAASEDETPSWDDILFGARPSDI